jgi:cellobiose-specific phosphotransferase system component IIB
VEVVEKTVEKKKGVEFIPNDDYGNFDLDEVFSGKKKEDLKK